MAPFYYFAYYLLSLRIFMVNTATAMRHSATAQPMSQRKWGIMPA